MRVYLFKCDVLTPWTSSAPVGGFLVRLEGWGGCEFGDRLFAKVTLVKSNIINILTLRNYINSNKV